MTSIQVNLPDDIARFVKRVLGEKKWDSVDDLIAYALSNVEAEMRLDDTSELAELRSAIRIGIEQADRGELVEGRTVMKKLRDKLEAARKQSV